MRLDDTFVSVMCSTDSSMKIPRTVHKENEQPVYSRCGGIRDPIQDTVHKIKAKLQIMAFPAAFRPVAQALAGSASCSDDASDQYLTIAISRNFSYHG